MRNSCVEPLTDGDGGRASSFSRAALSSLSDGGTASSFSRAAWSSSLSDGGGASVVVQ